jgi:hypothetical protein
MRKAVIALVTIGVLATAAVANQCPLLIKQLTDAVATRGPDDARAKTARGLIEQARKLHAEGRHAASIAKADEAAKVLGITLNKQ